MTKYKTELAGHILTVANSDDERRELYLAVDDFQQRMIATPDWLIKDLAIEYLRDKCGVTMRKNAGATVVISALLRQCIGVDKLWMGTDLELDRVAKTIQEWEDDN